MRLPIPRQVLAGLAATALLAGSCAGTAAELPAPIPTPEPSATATATDHVGAPLSASWDQPFTLSLPGGWTVTDCEGDAPLWCFWDGGTAVGAVELGRWPASDEQAQAPTTVLPQLAADFLTSMRIDRALGCPGFTFGEQPTVPARMGDWPAVRTGFSLTAPDGREVERVVVHLAIAHGTPWSVNASAYESEGCLAPEGRSFTVADLGRLSPLLDRIVADTPLPDPT